MKESIIYHTLKPRLIHTKIQRVENSIDLGTPDMYFSNKVNTGWIESKAFLLPVRIGTPVHIPFRPCQFEWLQDNMKKGGLSILAIHTGEKKGFYFAVNTFIQKIYTLDDFASAFNSPNKYTWPLRFITKDNLVKYFEQLPIN